MAEAPHELVTLTIDDKDVTVPKGTLLIRAAEELGIEIPRFCDHPLLEPVAACRQCYVKVEGQRKLMTSCSTPVAPNMVVHTQFTDDEVHRAQVAVLEFLLINHPLDCPVCDRGGECPLQDQALAYGPGESRYREAKRTYRKPIPLSSLVALDRERCVLCARCTRFCDQVSGDRFIELFDRGAAEQVSIAPGEDLRSPFSGNVIQICPVGALTARTYRFVARPFDLAYGDSICPHCACGCNMKIDLRRGEVVRHLARDNYDVNDAWLCDKGRFAFRFADHPDRLTMPLLRERGLEPVSFAEALGAIASWSKGRRVAFLTGGRLSDEDAYALGKLARVVYGTNDLDHRRASSANVPIEVEQRQAAGMPLTYKDIERARAILVVGLDAEQELPILHLRIRKAARRGATVFVVHPRRTRLWDVAGWQLCPPGQEADLPRRIQEAEDGSTLADIRAALMEAGQEAVILSGPLLVDSPGALAALSAFATEVGARFAHVCRRANDRGALRAGVHPGLLPGGRRIGDAADRAVVESAWGADIPTEPGRDTAAILRAAASRELDVLFLVAVDPLRDFPDAGLARRALENVPSKVVVDISADAMSIYADAMLPAAPYLEKDGHYTDWEGRPQRLKTVRPARGLARSEWEIFQELSEALGMDMGFHSLENLHDEMGRLFATRSSGSLREPEDPPSRSIDGDRPVDDDSLVLFSYPLLIDEGALSVEARELKDALEDLPFVEVSVADGHRLGLRDGAMATVTTPAGSARLTVRVTDGIAEGALFVPWNQPGLAANTLLSGSSITTATLEPATEPVGVAAR